MKSVLKFDSSEIWLQAKEANSAKGNFLINLLTNLLTIILIIDIASHQANGLT